MLRIGERLAALKRILLDTFRCPYRAAVMERRHLGVGTGGQATPWAAENLGFDAALVYLRDGLTVARAGWSSRGTWLYLVPGSTFPALRDPLRRLAGDGVMVDYRPHIDMRHPDGTYGVWVPSHSDLLAFDWYVV